MSNETLAAQVEGSPEFQNAVLSAVVRKAESVRGTDLTGSQSGKVRAALADLVLADKSQAITRFSRSVALGVVSDDGAYTVENVYSKVDELWDTVAGVPSVSGALAISSLAQSQDFQQRVYVIGAQVANDILVAPPAVENVQVNTVKRVFALKYQAGKFIGPQHQYNYAVNVLAALPDGISPDDITDEQIKQRLVALTDLFAETQVALTSAGVNTGLLS